MSIFNTILERDGNEIEVQVHYTYYPASKGKRDSLCGRRNAGPLLEPDEPAFVDIEMVFSTKNEVEITLTPNEDDALTESIMQSRQDSVSQD